MAQRLTHNLSLFFGATAMSEDDEPSWVEEQTSERVRKFESRVSSSSSSPQLSPEPLAEEPADTIAISDPSVGSAAATKAAATKGSRGHGPPASCLPLVLGSRVRRDGLLIEAADPKFDLSGDFGAIGRLHVNCGGASEKLPTAGEGQSALTLDIKGRVYDCDILPSNGTICLLAIDGNKAQIETVYDSYVRLSSGLMTHY
tara:strand:- start:9 stop:611 length:603 start_codon:yes stop_codon:yes gene_type:complete